MRSHFLMVVKDEQNSIWMSFKALSVESNLQNAKSSKSAGQLILTVDYKGMDADISILSGGELQRVIVAFNLALSELFSLPMILLDECTSNLDQELTEIVVRGIRNNSKGKMIIMIAHQVVQGLFDKVIEGLYW